MRARAAQLRALPAALLPAALLLAVLVPAVVLLAVVLLAVLVPVGPAQAATREVRLTQDGPRPVALVAEPGDTVRFVNADTFVHRVTSRGAGWDFDSGVLLPGAAYRVPRPLAVPGTYAYRGTELDRIVGTVLVAAAGATPVAVGVPPSAGSAAPEAPLAPAAVPPPTAAGPVGANGQVSAPTGGTVPGPLPGQATDRAYGLPVALALLAAGGVLSLLLRLLLAEPAAGRVPPGATAGSSGSGSG